MTRKPSSQQVFLHSGFFFLRSFSQSFLHFFMVAGGFLLHFFFLILHFLLSTKPSQSSLGGGGGGGGDGSHSLQVFLHFASFTGS